jgi:hypothetical protein
VALALLRVDDTDEHQIVLEIDTGTSPYYRIHLGKEVRREHGFTLLDQVHWSSPVHRNPAAGRHITTSTRHLLDPAVVTERGMLVQVESLRDPSGRGPAWSRPVRLPLLAGATLPDPPAVLAMTTTSRQLTGALPAVAHPLGSPVRTVPVRSARDTYSRPASLEDLLGAVVRVAGPVVLDLVRNAIAPPAAAPGGGAAAGSSGGTAAGSAGVPATDPTTAAVAALLQTVLGALARTGGPLATASSMDSRFGARREHATPFIAPALLAAAPAIGALAGPVLESIVGPIVQALPQLFNAANQHKLESRRESHQHISDILAQVDRTRLLEQLIAARSAAPAPAPADSAATGTGATAGPPLSEADLAALIGLLQAGATAPAPTGTTTTAATTAPSAATAAAQSITGRAGPLAAPRAGRPSRAVLEHVVGPTVERLGAPAVVFLRGRPLTLRYRLQVPPDGPGGPLPRAALHLVVREPGAVADLLVRREQLTDVRPGEVRSVSLSAAEVDALPADTDLDLTASLRWPGSRETWQATCSRRIVLAGQQQVLGTGAQAGARTELTDMARFRSFWNRVWSSPSSDDGGKGPMWGLDVALRYSVVATPARTNGLMETRVHAEPQEHESVRVHTRGRMKSGLELAVEELNALLPLWPGEQPLDADTLSAFTAPAHLAGQGGDVVHRLRLEGRRDTRGLVWVVPVPTLRSFTVATVRETDAFGQVLTVEPREVRFPVVEAVRVLGLVSDEDEAESSAAGYRFEGYRVALEELVALEPAVKPPSLRTTPGPTAVPAAAAGGA